MQTQKTYTPFAYTESEGGEWRELAGALEVTERQLSALCSAENVKSALVEFPQYRLFAIPSPFVGQLYIFIRVHSFAFEDPKGKPTPYGFARWDCVNGWTKKPE